MASGAYAFTLPPHHKTGLLSELRTKPRLSIHWLVFVIGWWGVIVYWRKRLDLLVCTAHLDPVGPSIELDRDIVNVAYVRLRLCHAIGRR